MGSCSSSWIVCGAQCFDWFERPCPPLYLQGLTKQLRPFVHAEHGSLRLQWSQLCKFKCLRILGTLWITRELTMIGVFVWFSLKTFLCFIPVLNECPKTRTVSRSCFVCSPSQVYGYVATTLRWFFASPLVHAWGDAGCRRHDMGRCWWSCWRLVFDELCRTCWW